MKTLSNVSLNGATVLNTAQQKLVTGGGDTSTTYRCYCYGGAANPPYNNVWIQSYSAADSLQIGADLNTRCSNSGRCLQVAILH